jgi:diguanylate cyclase (GGDEF)-like protein
MESTLTAYISLICVSGVFNLFLCVYVFFRKEHIQGATAFMLFTIALTIYCFSYAIGLTSSSMEQIMFWTTIQYIGMPVSAPLGLYMVLQFLGKPLRPRYALLLFLVPVVSLLLVATNQYHHFYYKSIVAHSEYGLPFLEIEIGLWYVIQGVFTFGCLFYGFIMLAARLLVTNKAYRTRVIVLLFGQLVPMATAFLYLIGATPAGIDPVPIVMWITSGLYIWAILSANMLSLLPIAKETIFDNMSEGVIVLDGMHRLVDFNTAAKQMFPELKFTMVGYSLNELWIELTGTNYPIPLGQDQGYYDLSLNSDNGIKHFQVRTSSLKQRKQQRAGSLIMLIDVTELKQLQRELELQAYYDGLTKLYNRAHFFKLVSRQLESLQQTQPPFTFILFDIDRFKSVNDRYGHDVGDQLLIHISDCCTEILPKNAIFARYGGEEFVIALNDYDVEQAKQFAEQLRKHLNDHPLQSNTIELKATASFGIAQLNWVEQQTLQSVLVQADQALYKAKRTGRNKVAASTTAEM